MHNKIVELFQQGKILARAMDNPRINRKYGSDSFSYDFSVWAAEYDIAKCEGLMSLSTTLLLPNENIPTYKAIGFLIDSDKADIRHISESDSGSNGNERDGDFWANETNIYSLSELANIIHNKHENIMNEVNINMRENAYAGLFANKAQSPRVLANIILSQKYYELQTGIILPIFIYDTKVGSLINIDMTPIQKEDIIKECLDNKILRSSSISYEDSNGELIEIDYFDSIEKNKMR
jgi:hypothetical protein